MRVNPRMQTRDKGSGLIDWRSAGSFPSSRSSERAGKRRRSVQARCWRAAWLVVWAKKERPAP